VSNFAFLKSEWPPLHEAAIKAEALACTDARTACFQARRGLELLVHWLYKYDEKLRLPYQDNLSALIHEPTFKQIAGEAVFNKPFPHDAAMSCASCHQADAVFVDHKVHDIGTGGFFETKTLVNANFNAPYFHDGRFDTFDEVVGYFDKHYDLGLSGAERADLVAYLETIGDADEPTTRNSVQAEVDELSAFVSVLDVAIPARDTAVILQAIDSVGAEWREIGERFPDRRDTSIEGGIGERLKARASVRGLVLTLRQVAMAAEAGDFTQATRLYAEYGTLVTAATPQLKAAEQWSLFNPEVHRRHFAALAKLAALGK